MEKKKIIMYKINNNQYKCHLFLIKIWENNQFSSQNSKVDFVLLWIHAIATLYSDWCEQVDKPRYDSGIQQVAGGGGDFKIIFVWKKKFSIEGCFF